MKILLCLLGLLAFTPAMTRAGVTFEVVATYDYPGFVRTVANKINESGDVGGLVDDLAGHRYGYIRNADGHLSNLISFPGTTFTGIFGINNLRQVCGAYDGGPQPGNGFRANRRQFVTTNFPRAHYTAVFDLNDAGNYCGYESDGGTYFAFINIDKTYTTFGIPGQDTTVATDINNLNQSVGYYSTEGLAHSFFRDADGTLTYPIDGPAGFDFTRIFGMDDTGRMVGSGCFDGTCYGLLFLTTSDVAVYSYPGAFETVFTGINSSGIISGYWDNGLNDFHGLIVAATISEN